ncbi:MAG: SDR family NAD(P)-dependent oxidoreductase [Bacteroidetes bacterium]|nr:SDR family NAD(P)-dependent oxidoreductase [Bacteroidota bacterium]
MKTWLITGISSGLGQALAKAVNDAGDFVIGTFRQQSQVDEFNRAQAGKALGVKMDVTNREEVLSVIEMVKTNVGKLDVVVNNAGFGFAGAIEEASVEEVRAVMEANFFGALHVTQSVLPILRKQRDGHIIQISSHGGFKATAGFGIYNASKFALEGMSEALAGELLPLGIRLTIVEPGPFRTSFAGSGFRLAEERIDDYQFTAGLFRERIKSVDGKQEGDPNKAALAIISLVHHSNPPLRLPLGKAALATISSKLSHVQQDIDNWSNVAQGAVY